MNDSVVIKKALLLAPRSHDFSTQTPYGSSVSSRNAPLAVHRQEVQRLRLLRSRAARGMGHSSTSLPFWSALPFSRHLLPIAAWQYSGERRCSLCGELDTCCPSTNTLSMSFIVTCVFCKKQVCNEKKWLFRHTTVAPHIWKRHLQAQHKKSAIAPCS